MSSVEFPSLEIRPDDVATSWKEFYDGFRLAAELAVVEMGKVGNTDQDRFSPRLKLVTLLHQIRTTGRNTLEAEGLTLDTEGLTYERAIEVLRKHYEKTDSLYVKTQKFVMVRQYAGEDYGSYLLRVEKLSRELNYFKHSNQVTREALQEARQNLALVLAVNGIRDAMLCRELMARDLNWDTLGTILRARDTAEVSVDKLGGDPFGKDSMNGNSCRYKRTVRMEKEVNNISYVHRDGNYIYDCRDQQERSHGDRDNSHDQEDRQHSQSRPTLGYRDGNRLSPGTRYSPNNDNYYFGYRTSPVYSPSYKYQSGYYPSQGSRPSLYMSRPDRRCYSCGDRGHISRTCPKIKCHACLSHGHVARDCGRSGRSDWRSEGRPCSNGYDSKSHTPDGSSDKGYVQFVEVDRCTESDYSNRIGKEKWSNLNQSVHQFRVNGWEVEFAINTGSEVSLLTQETSQRLRLRYDKPEKENKLVIADGSRLRVIGKSEVVISNNGISTKSVVHICEGLRCNMLGRSQIQALKLLAFIN